MARGFRTAEVLVFLLVPIMTLFGQPAVRSFVKAEGRNLVTSDGKTILLRGINLGNWLVPEGYMFKFQKNAQSPRKIAEVLNELIGPEDAAAFWSDYRDCYVTRDDIHFIKQSGLNSVRVPFNFRLFTNEDLAGVWREEGFALLQRLIEWCAAEGLWVILDMHCAPGGQTGDNIDDSWGYPWLFQSPALQERTIALWTRIAAQFRDEPTVIGYDLLNEPIATYFDSTALNGLLEPFYRRVVAGIREVDTNHVIFLGGSQWDTNFKVFGPPFAPGLAYTFHKYWSDTTRQVIQEYLDFRERYNVPIWMGESGENNDQWITSFRGLLERNNVGWCFWPYKKPEATSSLVSFALPEGYKAIAAYAEAPRGDYGELRKAMPDRAQVRAVLRQYLINCRFDHSHINEAYARALGLHVQAAK